MSKKAYKIGEYPPDEKTVFSVSQKHILKKPITEKFTYLKGVSLTYQEIRDFSFVHRLPPVGIFHILPRSTGRLSNGRTCFGKTCLVVKKYENGLIVVENPKGRVIRRFRPRRSL